MKLSIQPHRFRILMALIVFIVWPLSFYAGYAGAQVTDDSSWQERLALAGVKRDMAILEGHDETTRLHTRELLQALQEGVGMPQRTLFVARRAVAFPDTRPEMEAFKVMQNQRLIEQNARMIQLLEAQAKTQKPK